MSQKTLNVSGMKCGNCSAAIDKVLNVIPGVKATADHVKGLVELELDDDGKLQQIKDAIEDLGFDVIG